MSLNRSGFSTTLMNSSAMNHTMNLSQSMVFGNANQGGASTARGHALSGADYELEYQKKQFKQKQQEWAKEKAILN